MFFSITMIGVGILTLGFEVDVTSYLFHARIYSCSFHYNCSTICMVDGLRMDGRVRVVGTRR